MQCSRGWNMWIEYYREGKICTYLRWHLRQLYPQVGNLFETIRNVHKNDKPLTSFFQTFITIHSQSRNFSDTSYIFCAKRSTRVSSSYAHQSVVRFSFAVSLNFWRSFLPLFFNKSNICVCDIRIRNNIILSCVRCKVASSDRSNEKYKDSSLQARRLMCRIYIWFDIEMILHAIRVSPAKNRIRVGEPLVR